MEARRYKIPRSVLVVIHTPALEVLLLQRAGWPEFWQSVTGSLDREDEPWRDTAVREVREETGIVASPERFLDWGVENRFEIFARNRMRYAPGVTHNLEHVFSLEVPAGTVVTTDPREHEAFEWLPWESAAARTLSWSNREAILALPRRGAAR